MSAKPVALRRRKILDPGINLTPLLDAILNLVFFFLVSTQLRTLDQNMKVSLPTSESAKAATAQTVPVITLSSDGKAYYQGRLLVDDELELTMKTLAARGNSEVDIRGDREADLGRVIQIMDLCKRAGLKAVNINTQGRKQGGGS